MGFIRPSVTVVVHLVAAAAVAAVVECFRLVGTPAVDLFDNFAVAVVDIVRSSLVVGVDLFDCCLICLCYRASAYSLPLRCVCFGFVRFGPAIGRALSVPR